MPDIRDLLDREARTVEPTEDWATPTFGRIRRRRRVRRVATSGLALAISFAGLLVAIRAFDGSRPSRVAAEFGPNYRFFGVTVRPGEGPNQVLVFYGVRFDEYPGVHRCTWRAFGSDGEVVGQRTLILGYEKQHLEPSENAVEMGATRPAVRGEAFCEPERLDTPGIVEVDPQTPNGDGAQAIDQRVEAWAGRYAVRDMSRDEIQANRWALGMEYRKRVENAGRDDEVWLVIDELRARLELLQRLLRADRETTEPPEANYEMEATLVGRDDERPRAVWVRVDVSWDEARFPGVHYCSFRAFDEKGNVIGEVRELYRPRVDASKGHEVYHRLVSLIQSDVASADADCEPLRLDTPGIAIFAPPPETNDWEAALGELEQRVDAWAEEFRIEQMSADQLAGNMWALWGRPVSEEDSLLIRERMARIHRLCVLLPPGHEFRGGEFCD